MPLIQTDFDQVATVVDKLATAAQGMQTTLDTLDAECATLKGQWTGAAADAYQTAQANWTKGMRALAEILAGASRIADDANQALQKTEYGIVDAI